MDNSTSRFDNSFQQGCFSNFVKLSDGRLRTEDGNFFNIHRFMLAKSSNYFYALFSDSGEGIKDVLISGIRGDILNKILTYIYTRNLCITEANLRDILVAADHLNLDELIMDIRRQLPCHLSVRNCLSLFVAAIQKNHSDIVRQNFRFIQTHFEAIVQDDDSEIRELPLEALKKILSDKNLRARDESAVWLAIVKWVEADVSNRHCEVPDLLMHLTIHDVNESLASRILEHSIVADNPFCKEISQMKMSNPLNTNFEILIHYCRTHSQTALPLFRHRQPAHLNIIGQYGLRDEDCVCEIYVTYDENVDLWRKITEISARSVFLLCLGSDICAFNPESGNLRYNLADKEWVEMRNLRWMWGYDLVVKLEGLIYVLGGYVIVSNGELINKVEVYDPESNVLSEVAPMLPITSFSAVTLGKHIYVIGNTPSDLGSGMTARVYEQETNTWMLLPPPQIFRKKSIVVAYHGRIFVFGGTYGDEFLKVVEVFDPSKDEWTTVKDLPCSYREQKAVVFCGNLFVYDSYSDRTFVKVNSPVQWNDGLDCWNPVEPSSPLNDLHRYQFFTLDNLDCISKISRENRDPETTFVKSPFN